MSMPNVFRVKTTGLDFISLLSREQGSNKEHSLISIQHLRQQSGRIFSVV